MYGRKQNLSLWAMRADQGLKRIALTENALTACDIIKDHVLEI
jgi:hypothetical protein